MTISKGIHLESELKETREKLAKYIQDSLDIQRLRANYRIQAEYRRKIRQLGQENNKIISGVKRA